MKSLINSILWIVTLLDFVTFSTFLDARYFNFVLICVKSLMRFGFNASRASFLLRYSSMYNWSHLKNSLFAIPIVQSVPSIPIVVMGTNGGYFPIICRVYIRFQVNFGWFFRNCLAVFFVELCVFASSDYAAFPPFCAQYFTGFLFIFYSNQCSLIIIRLILILVSFR